MNNQFPQLPITSALLWIENLNGQAVVVSMNDLQNEVQVDAKLKPSMYRKMTTIPGGTLVPIEEMDFKSAASELKTKGSRITEIGGHLFTPLGASIVRDVPFFQKYFDFGADEIRRIEEIALKYNGLTDLPQPHRRNARKFLPTKKPTGV